MKLEDVTGKSLLAIKVFGLSIQALTSHMRKLLENEGTDSDSTTYMHYSY
jgi:hypothetical protein